MCMLEALPRLLLKEDTQRQSNPPKNQTANRQTENNQDEQTTTRQSVVTAAASGRVRILAGLARRANSAEPAATRNDTHQLPMNCSMAV